MITLLEVSSITRIDPLNMAFYDKAIDSYTTNIENSEMCKYIRNASALFRIVGKGLEKTELRTRKRIERTTLTLDDMQVNGEPMRKSFKRLRQKAIKITKISGKGTLL